MNDHILDPQNEANLFQDDQLPQDFWQRYFAIQKVATMVDWQDGSFDVQVKDHQTGQTTKLANVKFDTKQGYRSN